MANESDRQKLQDAEERGRQQALVAKAEPLRLVGEFFEDLNDEVGSTCIPLRPDPEYIALREGFHKEMQRAGGWGKSASEDDSSAYTTVSTAPRESSSEGSDGYQRGTFWDRVSAYYEPFQISKDNEDGLLGLTFYLLPMLFVGFNWQDYGAGPRNAWIFGVAWPLYGGLGGLAWLLGKLIGRNFDFGYYIFINAVKGLVAAIVVWIVVKLRPGS